MINDEVIEFRDSTSFKMSNIIKHNGSLKDYKYVTSLGSDKILYYNEAYFIEIDPKIKNNGQSTMK